MYWSSAKIADSGLIERYNALKRAYEGGSYDEHQAAKRDLFYANSGCSVAPLR